MTELSPAAQAVLDAYEKANDCYREERGQLAAALRAAVAYTKVHPGHDIWQCDADELIAIADELEAQ